MTGSAGSTASMMPRSWPWTWSGSVTVRWLSSQQIVPMSREEAYALTSMVGDCRVTQVVDVRKGVHCMIPKRVFVGYRKNGTKGT